MPGKSKGGRRKKNVPPGVRELRNRFGRVRGNRIFNISFHGFPVCSSCNLPISTRGIGFMIVYMVKELERQDKKYVEEMPDLPTIYRASLAQLSERIDNSNLCGSNKLYYWHLPPVSPIGCNLSGVALIINSIGHLIYRTEKLYLIFEEKLSPLNLQITNLREYCVKMADLETEASFRMSGYQLNSIPGAIWKREDENDPGSIHLANPDDIISENYDDSHRRKDLEALRSWMHSLHSMIPDFVTGIRERDSGNASLLVSVHVDPEDTLRIENNLIEGDQKNFWSVIPMNDDAWGLGIVGLMGEVLDPTEGQYRSKVTRPACRDGWKATTNAIIMKNQMLKKKEREKYEMQRLTGYVSSTRERSETTLNSSFQLSVENSPCPLEISTRGIGFMLAEVENHLKYFLAPWNKIPIAAIYRASLAQLEARILFSGYCPMSGLSNQVAQEVEKMPYNFLSIVLLINTVGRITYRGMCFEPRFTEEITSPLSLRITNLRKYCEEMANPETDPAKRVAGYKLNSIPNAKWKFENIFDLDSIILTNPDEIIPSNYNIDHDLKQDLSTTDRFLKDFKGHKRGYYLRKKSIRFRKNGDPGILVSTKVFPDQCLRLDETNSIVNNNIKEFWSCQHLEPYSWYVGATSLVGEFSNSSTASHRSKNLAAYTNGNDWDSLLRCLF